MKQPRTNDTGKLMCIAPSPVFLQFYSTILVALVATFYLLVVYSIALVLYRLIKRRKVFDNKLIILLVLIISMVVFGLVETALVNNSISLKFYPIKYVLLSGIILLDVFVFYRFSLVSRSLKFRVARWIAFIFFVFSLLLAGVKIIIDTNSRGEATTKDSIQSTLNDTSRCSRKTWF